MWRGRAHAILYTLNTPADQRYEHGLAIVESKRWNLPLDRDVNQAASSTQTFYKKEVMRTFIISLLIHTRYPKQDRIWPTIS